MAASFALRLLRARLVHKLLRDVTPTRKPTLAKATWLPRFTPECHSADQHMAGYSPDDMLPQTKHHANVAC